MIVVSNTSPLCYLAWIGHLDILPRLFGGVTIPDTVHDELTAPGTPDQVQTCFRPLPEWLHVRFDAFPDDETLRKLHRGERDAIALAEMMNADLVLLDDRAARQSAEGRGLHITGLLGILAEAGQRQMLQLPTALEKLQQTSFRASPELLKLILDQATTPNNGDTAG